MCHVRLGHPNDHILKLVLIHCNIPISNKETTFFCSAYAVGKSLRLLSSISTTTYSKPLELVYSYLWGPSPMSSFGAFRYYLAFVDAYSRFTWIYLLKSKADTFTVFKQFKNMVELQFSNPLKALQTDWRGGGESSDLSTNFSQIWG